MDIVYVKNLRVKALIGIYEWERRIQQEVRIDLEMAWDNRIPAASDDIKHTLNYKEAAQKVTSLVQGSEYQLVETLAETIAKTLIDDMQLPWIKVTLGKPFAVSDSDEVGVQIERSREDFHG